jgi:hypothetical protein
MTDQAGFVFDVVPPAVNVGRHFACDIVQKAHLSFP